MNTRVTAVAGLQYGNEEKESIVSFLADDADLVIRGTNGIDGSSVQDNTFRGLPSGALNPDAMNIYGAGTVIDFKALHSSIEHLKKETGRDVDNIFIDQRAAVRMPYHRTMADVVLDRARGLVLRAGDIMEDDVLKARIACIAARKDPELEKKLDQGTILAEMRSCRAEFANFIIDTTPVIRDSVEDRGKVIIEGEGGLMKDPRYGIADPEMFGTGLGAIAEGAGVSGNAVSRVIGVAKCYTSMLGDDRFATRTDDRISEVFLSSETDRRCHTGWIDATALDYACYIDGVTELALTRIDALDRFDKVRICTGYMIEGEYYSYLPERVKAQKAQPIYETMDGWMKDTYGLTAYEDLPENARAFLERIAEATGRKLAFVTTGPGKENVIRL